MNELRQKNLSTVLQIDYALMISNVTIDLINRQLAWNQYDIDVANLIIIISNILYNDTSIDVLPLDDGLYDQLIVILKRYNPNYQVGAEPIIFNEYINQESEFEDKKLMYHTVNDSVLESKLYANMIHNQYTPIYPMRPRTMYNLVQPPITKRLIDTKHNYPELVGTLDKCKFVLNVDANEKGVLNNPAVQVFERDFIHLCMRQGVISPNEIFEMVGELKYDGVSVEAEVCGDTIISALSRGDTAENIATDLTPIFKNYKFYNAKKVPKDIKFGIKFEAVLTYRNLELLSKVRGKTYKNGRNAMTGLLGASDAYAYTDYITLIPLSCSLDMPREDELKFLNKYYNCGEYNRYCIFRGTYQEILFQVKQFTESAEVVRPILPYMIDGVVISFTDPNKIRLLGRVNSVNKYQMAIKFNPKKVRTTFLGYTYNIGKSGEVIPMVHFKPAEFIGTIHTKQTIHSFKKFNELKLIKGQQIDVEYVNDVMSYVTKPDTELNRMLANSQAPEEFIKVCPYCGTPIEISESMKSARCPNVNCHERKIFRMVDMIDRLGFKDFSEETVRALDLTDFSKLVKVYDYSTLESILGPITAEKFIKYQSNLLNSQIEDYKIMAALGFDGIGEEKWKLILRNYDLYLLFHMNPSQLMQNLTKISGMGNKTVEKIIEGFTNYSDDINFILNNINIKNFKDASSRPKVAITGTRDPMIIDIINTVGYDCSDKYSVTKDTAILITTDKNSTSGKMLKAIKYGVKIMTPEEFMKLHKIELNTF